MQMMMMILRLASVLLVLGAVLAVPRSANAQLDYDGLRDVRAMVSGWGAANYTWIDHQEEDTFTRETNNYVQGWGETGVLFVVASCDSVSILFVDRGVVFADGTVEAIWDSGPITTYSARDLDYALVIEGSEWIERLRTSNEVRIRVRAVSNRIASDAFDLTAARLSSPLSGTDSAVDVAHVREVFDAIVCE